MGFSLITLSVVNRKDKQEINSPSESIIKAPPTAPAQIWVARGELTKINVKNHSEDPNQTSQFNPRKKCICVNCLCQNTEKGYKKCKQDNSVTNYID